MHICSINAYGTSHLPPYINYFYRLYYTIVVRCIYIYICVSIYVHLLLLRAMHARHSAITGMLWIVAIFSLLLSISLHIFSSLFFVAITISRYESISCESTPFSVRRDATTRCVPAHGVNSTRENGTPARGFERPLKSPVHITSSRFELLRPKKSKEIKLKVNSFSPPSNFIVNRVRCREKKWRR